MLLIQKYILSGKRAIRYWLFPANSEINGKTQHQSGRGYTNNLNYMECGASYKLGVLSTINKLMDLQKRMSAKKLPSVHVVSGKNIIITKIKNA